MCFDSLNSSDIACGEYASRTLAGKQAPSMAKTTAIDSKQCRRAKPKGSPALLCATLSRFQRDNMDRSEHFLFTSVLPGRFSGQAQAKAFSNMEPYWLTEVPSDIIGGT